MILARRRSFLQLRCWCDSTRSLDGLLSTIPSTAQQHRSTMEKRRTKRRRFHSLTQSEARSSGRRRGKRRHSRSLLYIIAGVVRSAEGGWVICFPMAVSCKRLRRRHTYETVGEVNRFPLVGYVPEVPVRVAFSLGYMCPYAWR